MLRILMLALSVVLGLHITFRRLAHTPAEIASINLGHGAQPNKLIPLKRMLRAIILIAFNFIYLNQRGRCAKRMLVAEQPATK